VCRTSTSYRGEPRQREHVPGSGEQWRAAAQSEGLDGQPFLERGRRPDEASLSDGSTTSASARAHHKQRSRAMREHLVKQRDDRHESRRDDAEEIDVKVDAAEARETSPR